MSLVSFDFRSACTDLTEEEHTQIKDNMERCCPKGHADGYSNYAYRLYWLARAVSASKIVELGVASGASTLPLLLAAKRTRGSLWSCDVAGIDDFPFSVPGATWEKRSGTRADDLGKTWSYGPVDMVYLDTSHEYEVTKTEISIWWPHVREGGLFVFHDVESGRGTVFRAIADAMIGNAHRAIEYHHFPDCYGHGALQWFDAGRFQIPPFGSGSVVGLSTLLAEAMKQ